MKTQLLFPSTCSATVVRCPNRANSVSNINIWSQSCSRLSKYSKGEGKVAKTQASCCVYYFSVWPLTYCQKKDCCLWKQLCFESYHKTEKKKESKKRLQKARSHRLWSRYCVQQFHIITDSILLKIVELATFLGLFVWLQCACNHCCWATTCPSRPCVAF